MKGLLASLPAARSILIVVPERVETIDRAAGNLPDVVTIQAPLPQRARRAEVRATGRHPRSRSR